MVVQHTRLSDSEIEISPRPTWGFLTNHTVILIFVALHPDSTVRTIAHDVGITERATLAIIRDLDDEGILVRTRIGRRNAYSVDFRRLTTMRRIVTDAPLNQRPFSDAVIQELFKIAARVDPGTHHAPPWVSPDERREARRGDWAFFTNHMSMLFAISRGGSKTVRELAARVGVTERAAVAILNQLEAEGIIERTREGRRNSNAIDYERFIAFRGWTFDQWRIPAELAAVAAKGISMLEEAGARG